MFFKKLAIIAVFSVCTVTFAHAQGETAIGSASDKAEPLQKKKKFLVMPSLKGLTKARAIAKLKALGHKGRIYVDDRQMCPSNVRVRRGQICKQSVYPGKRTNMRVPVSLVIKQSKRKTRKKRR